MIPKHKIYIHYVIPRMFFFEQKTIFEPNQKTMEDNTIVCPQTCLELDLSDNLRCQGCDYHLGRCKFNLGCAFSATWSKKRGLCFELFHLDKEDSPNATISDTFTGIMNYLKEKMRSTFPTSIMVPLANHEDETPVAQDHNDDASNDPLVSFIASFPPNYVGKMFPICKKPTR